MGTFEHDMYWHNTAAMGRAGFFLNLISIFSGVTKRYRAITRYLQSWYIILLVSDHAPAAVT